MTKIMEFNAQLFLLVFFWVAMSSAVSSANQYPPIFLDGDAIKDEYKTVRNTGQGDIIW